MSRTISKKHKNNWVSDAYSDLSAGQTRTGRSCGRCFKQEVQGEDSSNPCALAVIRKANGLEYNCFKPSCELGGGAVPEYGGTRVYIRSGDNEQQETAFEVSSKLALPKDFTRGVSGPRADWIASYGLNAVDVARYGIGECRSDAPGLYFPVEDLHGDYCGYLRRDVDYGNKEFGRLPGSIKWVNKTKPGSFFMSKPWRTGLPSFIVEDAVSCIRVGQHYPTLALARVYLGKDSSSLIQWFNKVKPSKLIIALDRDVDHIAKSLRKDLTKLFPCVSVLTQHTADPKNWTEEEVHLFAS